MSATTEALTSAISTEDAVLFTYGVVLAHTTAARAAKIRPVVAAHRARREELADKLRSLGGTAPEPAIGYTVPQPVDDPVSALTVALAAEVDCTVAYRSLAERAETADVRTLAVQALTDTATTAAQWRQGLDTSPVTVALPGDTTS